jgi:hypothetical protein
MGEVYRAKNTKLSAAEGHVGARVPVPWVSEV